jgi:hypothetical protein
MAFHPLDGARHVSALGQERLARLVADHSPARWEAEALGLVGELATFPREDSATSDARPLGWRRGAHRGAPAGRWCERLVLRPATLARLA